MQCSLFQLAHSCGKHVCTNLLLLHSSVLSFIAGLGKSAKPTSWLSSDIKCLECGVPVSPGSGLVCGNFGNRRENGLICDGAWHGTCYHQSANDDFPVLQAVDLDESFMGAESLEEDDPNRFKCAWEGDHLMCPFQCDSCHFFNIIRYKITCY
jgi:hypothetical protein